MSKTEEEYSWGVKDFKPEQCFGRARREKQPGKGRGMKIGLKKKLKNGAIYLECKADSFLICERKVHFESTIDYSFQILRS